ncbi:uncharacterized protein [Venturia canescens]|uniref:uncharacterized protein n=1 Tax=Venturia canescens TaxID=32260 RepID=UPI001C9C87B2|nr:uncharacterized protein LOC122415047 [Venturia canescens]
MIVPLIPLYLAAALNLTENEVGGKDKWKYGPEAIYEVRFECAQCIWYEKGHPETAKSYNETMELSCRSKSITALSCQLNPSNEAGVFELHFDRSGMKKIVVSSSIDDFILDLIRASVAQLNVAVDIFGLGKSQFEISENFFAGTCQSHYFLRSEVNVTDNEAREKPYSVYLPADMPPRNGEIKMMGRTRNIDKCRKRLDYFFSNLEPLHTTPSIFEPKLLSSRSLMTFGESHFSSWTENTIRLKDLETLIEENLTERITLTLRDIVPASGPLVNFKGPSMAVPIFLKNWVHERNSSEENSSSEENQSFEKKNFVG